MSKVIAGDIGLEPSAIDVTPEFVVLVPIRNSECWACVATFDPDCFEQAVAHAVKFDDSAIAKLVWEKPTWEVIK